MGTVKGYLKNIGINIKITSLKKFEQLINRDAADHGERKKGNEYYKFRNITGRPDELRNSIVSKITQPAG